MSGYNDAVTVLTGGAVPSPRGGQRSHRRPSAQVGALAADASPTMRILVGLLTVPSSEWDADQIRAAILEVSPPAEVRSSVRVCTGCG